MTARAPDTRQRSLESIAEHGATLRARVFDALAANPRGLTAEEVERWTGLSGNTVRPRLLELQAERAAMVDPSQTRKTRSGRAARVWVVVPAPVDAAERRQLNEAAEAFLDTMSAP